MTTTTTTSPATDWDAFEFALITADQAGPVGHLDTTCRNADGGPVSPSETPWPCGTCVPVRKAQTTSIFTAPTDIVPSRDTSPSGLTATPVSGTRGPQTEAEVPAGPEALRIVRAEAAERAYKYEVADVTPTRLAAAVEYAKTYEGDFEFMVEMRKTASTARGLHGHLPAGLSAGQAKGVLNCLRADVRRVSAAVSAPEGSAPEGAPAAEGRPNRYAGQCVCCHGEVAAGAGLVEKVGAKWETRHAGAPDACPNVEMETDYAGGRPRPTQTAAPRADVPSGHYAVRSTGSNDLAFYRVDRPTDGDYAGRVFVKLVIGGRPDQNVRYAAIAGVLDRIHEAGIAEAAALYGTELGQCCRCNRHLTDDESRRLGIGPECRKVRS